MDTRVRASEPQGATFVELFFDLVFVFAVTQVTHTLAEHLDATGVVQAVLVFWLVWWAWTQFTWTLNAADTEHPGVELLTMAGVVAAFLMALAVPEAYGATGGWFAGAYAIVRLVGIAGQFWVSSGDPEWRRSLRRWALLSMAGILAVAVGAALPPGPRMVAFAAAAGLDLTSAWLAGGGEWRLFTGHFAERHGLFVIIALGESLIVAGGAETAGGLDVVTVLPPVLVTVGLWWTYFGWAKRAMEEAGDATSSATRGAFCRDVYSLWHFLVIAGVIGVAVAIEETVTHPEEPLSTAGVMALVIGIVLFVGGTAAALARAGIRVPRVRLAALAVLVVAAVVFDLEALPPSALLGGVAVLLAVVAGVEQRGRRVPATVDA